MAKRYTANIADTVMFRNLGKHPSPHLQSLRRAVAEAGTEIWVPAAVYHELADTGTADSPVNPYLDAAIEDGWLRVATPLPGNRSDGFDPSADQVEQARFVADKFLNQQSKYPETNNWTDAAVVALAVRLFERNTRIRVITHTADANLARRTNGVIVVRVAIYRYGPTPGRRYPEIIYNNHHESAVGSQSGMARPESGRFAVGRCSGAHPCCLPAWPH